MRSQEPHHPGYRIAPWAVTACAVFLFLVPHLASACPPATSADFNAFPSTKHVIQPEDLFVAGDPTACPGNTNTSPCGAHYVYVPAANHPEPRQGQLYLFLPGTKSEPNKYEGLLSMAAYAGYKTIGLSYDNTARLESVCAQNCGCYGPARREVVFGVNWSPILSVRQGDSIVHRLYRLLDYLRTNFSAEGWDAFLANDDHDCMPEPEDFNWDIIIVSGHSQGAGHGMILSKDKAVDGILLFDGGNDDCSSGGRTYAQWHDWPDITAPRRSFVHDRNGSFAVPDSFIAMEFGSMPSEFDVLDNVWPTSFNVATTNQTPVDDPLVPPKKDCTEHGSMAYDGCMPDALGNEPVSPAEAYLFPFYLDWMCEVGN
ncbi:BPSS1187 family protein [Archangium lipolyticum]|uniref:BPSS1187 family protein n=1 Tax=Archangium lipolyticum TaxID=2970465 RepID=UPI002149B68F|nr:hypothetical protein [Archangium lipolyticum]